jgi:transposase
MGQGYSSDLRVRIIGAIEGGNSCRAAARRFGVSPSTSIRLAQRKAKTGSLEPARQGRPPGGGKLAPHADLLIGWVKAKGDITMPELAARLESARGVTVHPASLSRFLITRGFSVKKNTAGKRDRSQ